MKHFYRDGVGLSSRQREPVLDSSSTARRAAWRCSPCRRARNARSRSASRLTTSTPRSATLRRSRRRVHRRDPRAIVRQSDSYPRSRGHPALAAAKATCRRWGMRDGRSPCDLENLSVARGTPVHRSEPARPAARRVDRPRGRGLRDRGAASHDRDRQRARHGQAKAFYRDRLGLHLDMDTPWWVEFDAGGTTLALHPRPSGRAGAHHGRRHAGLRGRPS